MKIEILIFNSFDDNLEKLWLKFSKISVSTPFQDYFWLKLWFESVGSKVFKIDLKIVVILNNNEVVAILPLHIKKILNVRILEWIGGTQNDYMCPILIKNWNDLNINFIVIWNKILFQIKKFDYIFLDKQLKKISDQNNPFYYFFNKLDKNKCLGINLSDKNINYIKDNNKKKYFKNILRMEKNIKKLGLLKFNYLEGSECKKKIIDKMIYFKTQQYIKSNVRNMFENIYYKKFYKLLYNFDFISDIKLHVSSLTLNDEIISVHVGILDSNTFYYLMPSYDFINYRSYAPGSIHNSMLVDWCLQNKINFFDFTTGNEDYKKKWSNSTHYIYQYNKINSFSGFLFHNFIFFKKLIKKNINKFPFFEKFVKNIYYKF